MLFNILSESQVEIVGKSWECKEIWGYQNYEKIFHDGKLSNWSLFQKGHLSGKVKKCRQGAEARYMPPICDKFGLYGIMANWRDMALYVK